MIYIIDFGSQVTQLMGQDGIFRDEVRKIMNGPAGKNFRKNYKKAQDTGIELERKDFDNIHYLLTNALLIQSFLVL